MEVMILVCSLALTAPKCQKDTAIHVMFAEPVSELVACMRQGLLYAAESGLVTPGTYPKVFCKFPKAVPSVG